MAKQKKGVILNISSDSPLSRLPFDPNNGSTICGTGVNACYYSFICNGTSFEINGAMESTKFSNTGGSDVESDDGGNQADLYEVGNKLDI